MLESESPLQFHCTYSSSQRTLWCVFFFICISTITIIPSCARQHCFVWCWGQNPGPSTCWATAPSPSCIPSPVCISESSTSPCLWTAVAVSFPGCGRASSCLLARPTPHIWYQTLTCSILVKKLGCQVLGILF